VDIQSISTKSPLRLGRYVAFDELASGGMAAVHLGKLRGPVGFSRTVAIKRLHAHLAKDPEFVAMFLDEARLAARVHHPNVVPVLDVVTEGDELFLVMEYVHGETLSQLLRACREQNKPVPLPVIITILSQVLRGLHAAHEATNERGDALKIVHRDVSPQNVILGVDGVARVLDFGVAKAMWRAQTTKDGQIKGKMRYMAAEQLRGEQDVDCRVDIYAAAVVLWETLSLRPLVLHDNPGAVAMQVLAGRFEPPSKYRPEISNVLDAIVMRGLSANRDERCATALEMAELLEQFEMASAGELGRWVREACPDRLIQRAEQVSAIDRAIDSLPAVPSAPDVSEVRGREQGRSVLRQADAKARSEQPTVNLEEGLSEVTSAVLPSKRPQKKGAGTSVLLGAVALCTLAAMGYGGFAFTRQPPPSSQRVPLPLQVDMESAAEDDGVSTRAPAPTAAGKPAPVPASPQSTATIKRPPVSCDPPYVIDARGIKRFRAECMAK
jgi:eukaryotic-like serine/threonine-protein kinase